MSVLNAENRPLSMWSNRWSSITPYNSEVARLPNPDRRAFLDYMPATDCPVIRQPYGIGDRTSMFAAARQNHDSLLYDVDNDPDERETRTGEPIEKQLAEMLLERHSSNSGHPMSSLSDWAFESCRQRPTIG